MTHGYSEAALAHELRRALQSLAVPWYRRPSVHVFLGAPDSDLGFDAGIGAILDEPTRAALDAAEQLIVLASRSAAISPAVAREVAYWLAHRDLQRLWIVDTTGGLRWDADRGRFGSSAARCLPPNLLDALHPGDPSTEPAESTPPSGVTQPRWIDLGPTTSRRGSALRERVAAIAAALHARPVAELVDADRRHRRSARRLAVIGGAAVTVAAVTAMVGIVVATGRPGVADQSHRIAADRLTGVADRVRPSDPALAALFDVAAFREDPSSVDVRRNLLADESVPVRTPVSAPADFQADVLGLSPDGGLMAASSRGRERGVWLWHLAGAAAAVPVGEVESVDPATGLSAPPLAFSPDGQTLAVGRGDGVHLWHLTDPSGPVEVGATTSAAVTAVAFDHSGQMLAVATADGNATLWTVAEDGSPTRTGAMLSRVGGDGGYGVALAFGADGTTLTAGGRAGSLVVWNVADPARPSVLRRPAPATVGVNGSLDVVLDDGGRVASITDQDGNSSLWTTEEGSAGLIGAAPYGLGRLRVTAIGAADTVVAAGSQDGGVSLWRLVALTPTPLGPPLRPSPAPSPAPSPPGSASVAASDIAAAEPAGIAALALSRGGTVLAATDDLGALSVWQLPARVAGDPTIPASPTPAWPTDADRAVAWICAATHGSPASFPGAWRDLIGDLPFESPCAPRPTASGPTLGPPPTMARPSGRA